MGHLWEDKSTLRSSWLLHTPTITAGAIVQVVVWKSNHDDFTFQYHLMEGLVVFVLRYTSGNHA